MTEVTRPPGIPEIPEGGGTCIELTDIPGASPDWLESKAVAIESAMASQLNGKLNWHKVVANPDTNGFDIYFQVSPDGEDRLDSIPPTLFGIVRDVVGPK